MGKRSIRLLLPLFLLILAGLNTLGLAATATDTGTVNVYIGAAAVLDVSEASIAWGSAGSPLPGFSSGVLAPTTPAYGYLNVTARCNVRTGYTIAVRSTNLTDGAETIAATKLGFDLVDDGQSMGALAYLAAADTDLPLTATEPVNAAGKAYDLYVRLNLDGAESAGAYSGTITVTLTY